MNVRTFIDRPILSGVISVLMVLVGIIGLSRLAGTVLSVSLASPRRLAVTAPATCRASPRRLAVTDPATCRAAQ